MQVAMQHCLKSTAMTSDDYGYDEGTTSSHTSGDGSW